MCIYDTTFSTLTLDDTTTEVSVLFYYKCYFTRLLQNKDSRQRYDYIKIKSLY